MIEAIKITGRFASLALFAIIFEGILTLGSAFKFEQYDALAWIVQCLILVICVWGAAEWTESIKEESKSW
jgi:hypothetical protein